MSISQPVHGPRIDHLPARIARGMAASVGGAGSQWRAVYDCAAARLPAVRQFDGDEPNPAAMDDRPPQPQQARRDRLLPGLRTTGGHRHRPGPSRRMPLEDRGVLPERGERVRPGPVRGPPLRGWYRHITLAMLAHAFLAVMGGRAGARKGATRPTHPPSWASRRPRSVVCRHLNPRCRPTRRDHAVNWSRRRRRHQARARRCHSLVTGQVRAYALLRMFGREGRPTPLGQAFAEYGRSPRPCTCSGSSTRSTTPTGAR